MLLGKLPLATEICKGWPESALGLPDVFSKNTGGFVKNSRSRLRVVIESTNFVARDPPITLFTYFYSFISEFSCFTFSHIFGLPNELLLPAEIPSGMCAKLRTVAASNNRVHMP